LKTKILLFFAILMISLNLAALVYAQTGTVYFKEDFNYSSLDQMQTAGWTLTRPAGISVAASTVTLDGTDADCSMYCATSFSNNVYDWKAEVRAMWLGQGHSVLSVFLGTERHTYGWAADGYYKEFSIYRDNQKVLHFGIYEEKASQYVVLSMVREGNTFSFYFNGELKNTYTEQDTQQSAVTGLSLISPWKGDAKYDYYQIGEVNAAFPTIAPVESTSSFPVVPFLIGGGITAAVVGGVLVYYFSVAGNAVGSAAGGSAGSSGGIPPDPEVMPPPFNVVGQNVSAQGVVEAGSSLGALGVAGAQTGALETTPSVLAQAGASLQASGQNPPYGAGQGLQYTGQSGTQSGLVPNPCTAAAGAALQSTGNNLYGTGQGIQGTGVGVAGAQSQVQPQNSSTIETRTIKPKTEEKPTK